MMGIPRDHRTPYKKTDECHECGEKFKKNETLKSGKVVTLELYDDPWAVAPCVVRVHADNDDGHGACLDKLTDTSWADFRYFDCPICGRLVVSQCPDNGWRSYQKEMNDDLVCVRCYQDHKLKHGEDDFIGRIPGDFYNSEDLSTHGWSLVPGFKGKFINSQASVNEFIRKAQQLMKDGYKCLVNYESMGIGGGEGYVSLYAKR